eukprot:UN04459
MENGDLYTFNFTGQCTFGIVNDLKPSWNIDEHYLIDSGSYFYWRWGVENSATIMWNDENKFKVIGGKTAAEANFRQLIGADKHMTSICIYRETTEDGNDSVFFALGHPNKNDYRELCTVEIQKDFEDSVRGCNGK